MKIEENNNEFEIAKSEYNNAIEDILMMIVNGQLNGVTSTYPPEALIHVFNKLKK